MLDDISVIKTIDRSGMASILSNYHKQIEESFKIVDETEIQVFEPRKIIVCGMGGSAIGADLLSAWALNRIDIPIITCREYMLPKFVNREDLVIGVSYSGNTEETLSAVNEALRRKCSVIGISSGGLLEKSCIRNGLPLIKVPKGIPPRMAVFYLFTTQTLILERLNFVKASKELMVGAKLLETMRKELSIDVRTEENMSKQIAYRILDTYPIIYGSGVLIPIAKRLRTQLNENAKILARDDYFPETNHNDTVGWSAPELNISDTSVILLRDRGEERGVSTRIELTKKLVFQSAREVVEVWSRGRREMERMFSTMYICDFASYYLAILREIDPTPVEIIERLKKELRKKR